MQHQPPLSRKLGLVAGPRGSRFRRGDVEEPGRGLDAHGVEDLGVTGGGLGGLDEAAGVAGMFDGGELAEFVAQVAPGVVAGVLGDAGDQQREPAQQYVRPDALLELMPNGSKIEVELEISPPTFDFEQLLVAQRDVLGGQGRIRGAQQELAVELGVSGDGGPVDTKQPGLGGAQEPVVGGPGAQRPSELGALAGRQPVGAVDGGLKLLDDLAADGGVAFGLVGVAADDEPVTHRAVVEDDFLDLEVAGNRLVAALTLERSLGVLRPAAELLAHDVVAPATPVSYTHLTLPTIYS